MPNKSAKTIVKSKKMDLQTLNFFFDIICHQENELADAKSTPA